MFCAAIEDGILGKMSVSQVKILGWQTFITFNCADKVRIAGDRRVIVFRTALAVAYVGIFLDACAIDPCTRHELVVKLMMGEIIATGVLITISFLRAF